MVELKVPAQQDMLLVVRMALSGLGAKCGMDMDAVENIRIAVDEACFCLMHQRQPLSTLRINCAWDQVNMKVHLVGNRQDSPPQEMAAHDIEVARCILLTLVSEVDMQYDDLGVYGIDLTIRLFAA